MTVPANTLIPPKSPSLPVGPLEYAQRYQDQLLNILRLYFNTLDNTFGSLLGVGGGDYLTFSHGSFYDTTDQTATSTTTAYAITLNTTDISQGVSLVSSSQITVEDAGIYNIQFSVQLANDTNAPQDIDIWLRKNGVDIANSSSRFGLATRKSAGAPYHVIGSLNFVVEVQAIDYIELMWCTTDVGARIEHYPAGTSPTRPAIPSVIVTVIRVSDVVSSIYE